MKAGTTLIKVDVELYIRDRFEFGLTHRRKVIIRLQFGTFGRSSEPALETRNFIFTVDVDKIYAFTDYV